MSGAITQCEIHQQQCVKEKLDDKPSGRLGKWKEKKKQVSGLRLAALTD